MEQYNYQQPVVVEPVQEKKSVGLQIAALIIGAVGMVFAFLAYFATIFSNIGIAVAADHYGNVQGIGIASGVLIGIDALLAIVCVVGIILGAVGLIRSIRRATRTVKGIVMSAIGLNLSAAGFILTAIGVFISGFFRLLISTGAIH